MTSNRWPSQFTRAFSFTSPSNRIGDSIVEVEGGVEAGEVGGVCVPRKFRAWDRWVLVGRNRPWMIRAAFEKVRVAAIWKSHKWGLLLEVTQMNLAVEILQVQRNPKNSQK